MPEHLIELWESPGYEGIDLPLIRRVAAACDRRVEIRFTRAFTQEIPSQAGPLTKEPSKVAAAAQRSVGAATVLLAAGLMLLTGCITETESSIRRPGTEAMRTEGVIVTGPIDGIWTDVKAVVASMTREPLVSRGVDRSFQTTVGSDEVSVLVEAYDSTRTIVHVNSTNPKIADRIRRQVTLR
ncbi:MAG: hypothetical protein AAGG01_23405 [Planctomycetota bacterium]